MLLWLTRLLSQAFHCFRIFEYLTLRSIISALTALLIILIFGPWLIRTLTALQIGQNIRLDGPQAHLKKSGTPTMGGILIIVAVLISTLLWGQLSNRFLWTAVTVLITFSVIGGVDDYLKVVKRNSQGLAARYKFLYQSILGLGVAVYLYYSATLGAETQLLIPFLKDSFIHLGIFYILWTYFIIVGSSNSVNLTDGLDGLALMPIVMVSGALGVFAYVTGHHAFASYLTIPYIPGVEEMAVFCSSLVGAGLGFLWYNTYPAKIFMGDVGSLALGATLGVVAVIVRQEIVYAFMGGIFVVEALSVILQVAYFKYTGGKRIFRMAPLHHHFELKGWPEPRIIVRFWIITFVLVLCGLVTLKLR